MLLLYIVPTPYLDCSDVFAVFIEYAAGVHPFVSENWLLTRVATVSHYVTGYVDMVPLLKAISQSFPRHTINILLTKVINKIRLHCTFVYNNLINVLQNLSL